MEMYIIYISIELNEWDGDWVVKNKWEWEREGVKVDESERECGNESERGCVRWQVEGDNLEEWAFSQLTERLTIKGGRYRCRECGDNRERERCERRRESGKGLRDRNMCYL